MASNVYKEIKYNKKILLLNFAKVKVVAQQTRISKTATETSREAINQKFKVKHELKSVTIINVTTPFNTLDYAEEYNRLSSVLIADLYRKSPFLHNSRSWRSRDKNIYQLR